MYRPSMYNKHDETMLKFVEKFNGSLVCKNIEMRPNKVETYDNDGIFIDIYTNQSIGYDWEYRDRYFEHCKLEFDTLGQYERKLEKNRSRYHYSVTRLRQELLLDGMKIGFRKKEKEEH